MAGFCRVDYLRRKYSASSLSGPIKIGSHVHIAAYTALYGGGGITLCDFCNLSSRVSIYSVSDDYSGETMTNPTIPEEFKIVDRAPVVLGRHVIVGSGTVVLPGDRKSVV